LLCARRSTSKTRNTSSTRARDSGDEHEGRGDARHFQGQAQRDENLVVD
jgi:hypothetical protein